MAHRALVPDSSDIAGERLVPAQWPIAVDAIVNLMMLQWLRDGLIEGCKAMAWVALRSVANTFRAVVPVGAGQTFVTNTDNALRVYVSMRRNLDSTVG